MSQPGPFTGANSHIICSICLNCLFDSKDEMLQPQSPVVFTNCGHTFHESCADQAIAAKKPPDWDGPEGDGEGVDCEACPLCHAVHYRCEYGGCDGYCEPYTKLFVSEDDSLPIGPPFPGDFTIHADAVKQMDKARLAKTIGVKVDKVYKMLERLMEDKDEVGKWEDLNGVDGPPQELVKTLVPSVRELVTELQKEHGRDLKQEYVDKLHTSIESLTLMTDLLDSMQDLRDELSTTTESLNLAKLNAEAQAKKDSKLAISVIELKLKRAQTKHEQDLLQLKRESEEKVDKVKQDLIDLNEEMGKGRTEGKVAEERVGKLKQCVKELQSQLRRTEKRNTKSELKLQAARHATKQEREKIQMLTSELEKTRRDMKRYQTSSITMRYQELHEKYANLLEERQTEKIMGSRRSQRKSHPQIHVKGQTGSQAWVLSDSEQEDELGIEWVETPPRNERRVMTAGALTQLTPVKSSNGGGTRLATRKLEDMFDADDSDSDDSTPPRKKGRTITLKHRSDKENQRKVVNAPATESIRG